MGRRTTRLSKSNGSLSTRLDPKRAPELSQFIKSDQMNIVPGAIIIATTPGALIASPVLDTSSESGPLNCTVTVSKTVMSRDASLKAAIELLNIRLSEAELKEVEELEENEEEEREQLDHRRSRFGGSGARLGFP
jgi:hypothetical protein